MNQKDRILSILDDHKGLTSDQISLRIGGWDGDRWHSNAAPSVRRILVKMWRAGLVTRDESKTPYVYSKRRAKRDR